MSAFLSKSKYLVGIQCPKLLWHHYNAKDQLPEVDAATQALFDQGHEVGELAKRLHPEGIEVKWEQGFEEVVAESQRLLAQRKPLFEAGFRHENTYARADILVPVDDDAWDIVEVKSSTSVKGINLHDLAFQRYCYEGAGLRIRRCCLMYINNQYVRQGEINPEELFVREDVSGDVEACLPEVESRVSEMLGVINEHACPTMDIGGHCNDPYTCVLKEKCWDHVWSQENNVFDVGYFGQKAWDLYAEGITTTNSIPVDFPMQDRHRIQVDASVSGHPHVDSGAVRTFLDELAYPLYFLDFETFATAIPLLDGVRPYQPAPFQFSLHVVDRQGAEPNHHSWLWDGTGDPRAEMLTQLKGLLGTHGSIVAYNAGFETRILRTSVEFCTDYAAWWDEIQPRILDLMRPFRSYSVYYPQQHGSASMKAVLPALTGKGYDDMAISDGSHASQEFLNIMFADTTPKDRERVTKNLEDYCALDTLGMVDIIESLTALSVTS